MVSPYSIYTVLFWLWLGAKGKTSDAIGNVLKVREPYTKKQLFWHLDDPALRVVNRIFVNNEANILNRSFEEFLSKVDFNNPRTAEKINEYVAQSTNNKIQNFIDPPSFPEDTVMFLLNSLYFKGLWKRPFSEYEKRRFKNADGSKSEVLFMSCEESFSQSYLYDEETYIVEIPYNGTDITMVLLLPEDNVALNKLINNMTKVQNQIFNLTRGFSDINVSLPKFKIESTVVLDNILKKVMLIWWKKT